MLDASAATIAATPLAGDVVISNNYPLCPLGFNGIGLSGSTIVASAPTKPYLPFLYSTGKNFQEYRVTRAVLVFVSNRSSTDAGRVSLGGSKDAVDAGGASQQFGLVNGKQYDLATLSSSKEGRFNLPVDSSWKRVSALCFGNINGSWSPYNSVNDLCFSNAFIFTTGTSGSANIGTLYVEYDVEFRGPISLGLNL